MLKTLALMMLLISYPLMSKANQSWLFPLPFYFGDQYIGEANVFSDGDNLDGVPASELRKLLDGFVNDSLVDELSAYGSTKLSVSEIDSLGVYLKLDNRRLVIEAEFDESILEGNYLSLDGEYVPPIYSSSGFFALHNSYNFTFNYTLPNEQSIGSNWLAEWLIGGNIGGAKGLNFESSLYARGVELSNENEINYFRGDTRVFVDRPTIPMRISVGDINTNVSGHLPSVSIGGGALERSWSELQPNRKIQNGGSQTINLRQSAEVNIFVNDIFLRRIRLPPGKYQIDDLPLAQGSNDIRLEIRYQSGETQTINYSQFFNGRLLREGFSDFSLYAGVLSSIVDREYIYNEEQYLTSGYYDYGLNDNFTIGLNGLYHPDAQMLGTTMNMGTFLGNFGSRISVQFIDDSNELGLIASLDYEQEIWGNQYNSSPNLQMSFESFSDYRAIPWNLGVPVTSGISVNGRYTYYFDEFWEVTFRGDWIKISDGTEPTYSVSSDIGWSNESLSITLGSTYFYDGVTQSDDGVVFANISWSWYSDTGGYSANLSSLYSHSFEENLGVDETRVNFAKTSDNRVGDINYDIDAFYSTTNADRYRAKVGYTANKFDSEIEYSLSQFDSDSIQRVSTRLSSGLTLVDSNLAWGRSYFGPGAIVEVHESLSEIPVYINPFDGKPEVIATTSSDGLVGLDSRHSRTRLTVDIPEAPLGYDYGNGRYEVVPGSYTGHVIKVGSFASKTVIGKLVDENGKGISLRNGVAIIGSGEQNQVFFTNSIGRFVLEKMKSGTYSLELRGEPYYVGELTIPDNKENLVYLEAITLKIKGE